MFVVRSQQLEVFSEPERQAYREAMGAWLRRTYTYALESMSDVELDRHIVWGLRRALDHGFFSQEELGRFIELAVLVGIDFDIERDWAREILAKRGLRGSAEIAIRLYNTGILSVDLDD